MDELRRGGRPRSLALDAPTLRILGGCGRIQCTTKETAAFLRVAENTLLTFLKENPEARDAYEAGKNFGRLSLRRKQFRLADTNAAMAIFLGKNLLGQSDKQEIEHSGGLDVSGAKERLRNKVAAVIAAGAPNRDPGVG